MTTIVTILAGSKLYGLDGLDSDTDHKSIHIPDLEDCVLLRAARNVGTKEGEGAGKKEHESFALQEWLKLAANGEDVAVTMLHAKPEHMTNQERGRGGLVWGYIWESRKRFYTKRMRGSLGFAASQSYKYALRADRMAVVEKVIQALTKARDMGVGRLYQVWDDLPDGEHIVRTTGQNNRDALDKRIYEVAGKGLPATISPDYALEILTKLVNTYGDRVKAAKNMDGKDLKSLSHSFRVGYQLYHIYKDGGFSFPLPESDFIRAVKYGKLNYLDDRLDEKLNALITEVEALAEASTYPEKVDSKWLDSLVLYTYGLTNVFP